MKRNLYITLLVLFLVGALALTLGYANRVYFASKNLSELQARGIAEKTCIKGGEALAPGTYNQNSQTWWYEANLNSTRPGCKPACVVSEQTHQAEINWRCTGLLTPDVVVPSPSTSSAPVKVYFLNDNLDMEVSCNKVFPVVRSIANNETLASSAIMELLKGPTTAEKAQGYSTTINPGVKIQRLTIVDGLAKIDFDGAIEEQVAGSCRVAAIRSQITETLKQFTTVKEVIIPVNGRLADVLQP